VTVLRNKTKALTEQRGFPGRIFGSGPNPRRYVVRYGLSELRWFLEDGMSKITYKVVKHDGGWAYEANGTYSEPFPTREAARKAARLAASEQAAPGETTQISYEDEKGRWHNEVDSGTDRPKTTVEG
jgi:hypothetical protein